MCSGTVSTKDRPTLFVDPEENGLSQDRHLSAIHHWQYRKLYHRSLTSFVLHFTTTSWPVVVDGVQCSTGRVVVLLIHDYHYYSLLLLLLLLQVGISHYKMRCWTSSAYYASTHCPSHTLSPLLVLVYFDRLHSKKAHDWIYNPKPNSIFFGFWSGHSNPLLRNCGDQSIMGGLNIELG